MNFLFFSIVISICFYAILKRPGIFLAYMLFFQTLNKEIFELVGLDDLRYITTVLFFPILVLLHYKKMDFKSAISNFRKNKITLGYLLLTMYIIFYGYHIGSQYEIDYIKLFLFPGTILFIVGYLSFFNNKMYVDLFYGILIFAFLVLVSIFLFNISSTQDYFVEREMIGETTGLSPITQGRMAGLLIIFLMLIIQYKNKKIVKNVAAFLLIIAIYWLTLSGTRGALVSLFATIFFYINYTIQKKTILKNLLLSGIIIIPVLFYLGIAENLLFPRIGELFEPGALQSMRRYNRLILFFDFLPDNFIFGLGPGGWGKQVMVSLYSFRYPHNIIIEFILDYGIIGAISFSLIFFTSFKLAVSIVKYNKNNMYLISIALAWVFYMSNAMFSGSFTSGNYNVFTWSAILSGLYLYGINTKITSKKIAAATISNRKRNKFNKDKN